MLAAFLGLPLASCTALGALNGVNALTPGDAGVEQALSGEAFGADPRQRLDVYRPLDLKDAAPAIIFFYGGAWTSGRRQDYRFVGQALAARGFVTVIPDYRLTPAHPYPSFLEDGALAARWVEENIRALGGKSGTLSVCGHSAGAYIALMLALDRRWLAAAGVSPQLLAAAIGLAGPYDFYPFDGDITPKVFGTVPDPKSTQPINFVRGDAPRALLIAGKADQVVSPKNSIALAKALQAAGAQAQLELYPGLSHADVLLALSRTFRGKAPVLTRVTEFLRSA